MRIPGPRERSHANSRPPGHEPCEFQARGQGNTPVSRTCRKSRNCANIVQRCANRRTLRGQHVKQSKCHRGSTSNIVQQDGCLRGRRAASQSACAKGGGKRCGETDGQREGRVRMDCMARTGRTLCCAPRRIASDDFGENLAIQICGCDSKQDPSQRALPVAPSCVGPSLGARFRGRFVFFRLLQLPL